MRFEAFLDPDRARAIVAVLGIAVAAALVLYVARALVMAHLLGRRARRRRLREFEQLCYELTRDGNHVRVVCLIQEAKHAVDAEYLHWGREGIRRAMDERLPPLLSARTEGGRHAH